MVGIFPKEYLDRKKVYEPYMIDGCLKKAPPEAVEAFEKIKSGS